MASWDKTFWRATAERVIGTAAASGITMLTVANPFDIDWQQGLTVTGITAAVTFLKCIVANTPRNNDGPGFGNAERLNENDAH